jgi:hypothetical protein
MSTQRILSPARTRWHAALVAALCLTAGVRATAEPSEPGPTEGIVLLSITSNTGEVGQFNRVALNPVKREDGPRLKAHLENVAEGLARDTALFVGNAEQGEYEVWEFTVGSSYLLLSDGGRRLLGKVRVEAGAIADLGRIVVAPIDERVVAGRSTLVTSNVDLIRGFSPENAVYLDRRIGGGWVTPRTSEDRVEEFALDRPVGADDATELPTGEVVAGSRLGTIMVKGNDGQWRVARTGRLESLLSVALVPGEQLDGVPAWVVAGGELNTLVRMARNGAINPLSPGNLPPGNVLFVTGHADAGWFVAHQAGSEVTLYRSAFLDHGDWQAVRNEEVGQRWRGGPARFWIWRTKTGLGYAVSGGRIHSFEFASGAWTEQHAPNGDNLAAIAYQVDGSLSVLTSPGAGLAGAFASAYVSRDGGAQWTEVVLPTRIKAAPVSLLRNGTMLFVNGSAKPQLYASTDGGATWALRSESISSWDMLVPLPTRGLLAIERSATGYTSIKHSSDYGATWRTEYSNF